MQSLARVIVNDDMMTGWKSRILGYISSGDNVPEVITTVWYRSNTGLIAMDESKQLCGKSNNVTLQLSLFIQFTFAFLT